MVSPLIDTKAVAAMLGVKPKTVRVYYAGAPWFPPPIRMPSPTGAKGRLRWSPDDIEDFINSRRKPPARKPGRPRNP